VILPIFSSSCLDTLVSQNGEANRIDTHLCLPLEEGALQTGREVLIEVDDNI